MRFYIVEHHIISGLEMGRNLKPLDDFESSDKKEFTIGVRLPVDLVRKLDELAVKRKTTRSNEVYRAVEFLVDSITCPECETINSGYSFQCSYCGSPLSKYRQSIDEFILEIKGFIGCVDRLKRGIDECKIQFERLKWLVSREDQIIQAELNRLINPLYETYLSYLVKLDDVFDYYSKIHEIASIKKETLLDVFSPSYSSDQEIPFETKILREVISLYYYSINSEDNIYSMIGCRVALGLDYNKFQNLEYLFKSIHLSKILILDEYLNLLNKLLGTIETLIDLELKK